MDQRVGRLAPWLLAGLGVALYGVAAVWHLAVEADSLTGLRGPVLAFTLDGVVPLVLVYISYHLVRTEMPMERIWTVFVWSLAGGALFSAVMGLSVLIRASEGRVVAEPAFVMLLAADTGAVAGAVAGYYASQARQDADRAARATHTLSFVNDLLRHDISNSLTVVDGRASMLAASADEEGQAEAARAIREQADEIARLVENAGAVAETLTDGTTSEHVDLTEVVTDVVDSARATYDATIRLEAPDHALVRGNEAIRSVVRNLVENAIEHNDDDPTVDVRVEAGTETVTLHVADDGPGIPARAHHEIFDARAGETHGGGLHLVETLVESFGGDIRLAEGRNGAHFVVELPRVA